MLCGVISLEHGLQWHFTPKSMVNLHPKGVVIYTPGYVVYTHVLTVHRS